MCIRDREKLVSIMNEMKKEIKQIKAGKKSIKAYERPITNLSLIHISEPTRPY